DRLTGDVDFAADSIPRAVKSVRALEFGGETVEVPSGRPVDLIVRSDDFKPLYDEALETAVPRFELSVPVVAPEYIAAMKMVAGRGKDLTDLEFLIAFGIIDANKAHQLIGRLLGAYAAKEFDALVSEVEWKKHNGKLCRHGESHRRAGIPAAANTAQRTPGR